MGIQKLVDQYKKKPSSYLKNKIVVETSPLITFIIGKIHKPSTPLFDYDDLFNIGAIGLLQSLDSYSTDKDVKFNTFAYYRIRGSIIDYIRSVDELSRSNRSRYGAAKNAISILEQRLNRAPDNKEVAAEIGMELKDYQKLLVTVQQRSAVSLDMKIYGSENSSFGESLEDNMYALPDYDLLKNEQIEQLTCAIKRLPEREQLILALYYFEEFNLKEIASEVGLSEARISQILSKTINTLRTILIDQEIAA